jgi:hypothetical protein
MQSVLGQLQKSPANARMALVWIGSLTYVVGIQYLLALYVEDQAAYLAFSVLLHLSMGGIFLWRLRTWVPFFYTLHFWFISSFFVFLVLGGIVYWEKAGASEVPTMCLWVLACGLVCYFFGNALGTSGYRGNPYTVQVQVRSKVEYEMAMWLLVGAGLFGMIIYGLSVGGISGMLSRAYFERDNPSIWAGLYSLVLPGFFLLFSWYLWKCQQGENSRRLLWTLISVFAVCALWFLVLRGSRRHLLSLVISTAIIYRFFKMTQPSQAKAPWVREMVALGLAVFCLVVWAAVRQMTPESWFRDPDAFESAVSERAGETAEHSVYAPFTGYLTIVQMCVVGDEPVLLGGTYLDSAVMIVPRAFWPDKPTGYGILLWEMITGKQSDYTPTSVPTFAGEMLWNFHVAGLLFGMFVLGWLIGKSDSWIARAGKVRWDVWPIYAIAVPMTLQFVWGGSDMVVWEFWLKMLPVWVVQRIFIMRHARRTNALPRLYLAAGSAGRL